MKRNRLNLVWGVLLILFGGFYLLQTVGLIPELGLLVWSSIFAVVTVIFLVTYLINGWQAWGWLFPACIFAGLTTSLFLVDKEVDGIWIGGLFLASVTLPFWLAFAIDHKNNRWALIPAWVLTVLTAVIFLSNTLSGELLGSLIMLGIGLPFLGVFLLNRSNWWALIPGGILLTLAVVTLLAGAIESGSWLTHLLSLVTFWGMAVPFIYLWLRHDVYPTGWAKYPAAVLLLLGVVSPFVEEMPGGVLAVVLILVGGWLLLDHKLTTD